MFNASGDILSEVRSMNDAAGANGTIVGYAAVNPRGSEHKMVKKLVTACNDVTIKTNDLPLYMLGQNDAAQQMVFDVAMSLIVGWSALADIATGDEKNYDAIIKSRRIVDALDKAGHKK